MDINSSLAGMGLLIAVMLLNSLIEAVIPLHRRSDWGWRHLGPNLLLTLTTFATGLLLNVLLLLGLVWAHQVGLGLFNMVALPSIVATAGAIVVLDLAWYATHVSMHKVSALWRFHAVHHSDPQVDVTTTYRQHPGESLIRYAYLAVFALSAGASPLAFAIYRVWSSLHGQFEHANIKLPQWLDTAISWVFSSPNMHKLHHSSDQRFTDTNYTNIFSIWDRIFGTFTPSRLGTKVNYGLHGMDTAAQQSAAALLAGPFRSTAPLSAQSIPSSASRPAAGAS